MSSYIKVIDNKIIASFCGPIPKGDEYKEVPDGWPFYMPFTPNMDVRNFDASWELRPLADRIRDGLVSVSNAEVVDGETVRAKTQLERYRDGLDQLPNGKKIVASDDGTLSLKEMTRAEQVAAGQLSAQVAYSLDLADCEVNRKAAYTEESDPLFFKAQRGEATEEEWKNKIDEIKIRFPKPSIDKYNKY